ncbi:unnamed protein product [Closterium sp. Yama58-4]|nr:unnamed protein product [Closterium sp. Yama58-4]
MDPSPIHAQVQQLISRALAGIPPLPASHGTLANTQSNDPNRVPLKPLPQALANAGNPNACKICHVDILGGPKFRICLSCGAPSHLHPATRSSLDAGGEDTRSSDVSRGSSVTSSLPGTSVSGTPNLSNDKSGLWRNTRIERRYLMSLEFKPQDDKRRRSSSTQPTERTLAETLAGINAPPSDATSTRGSTGARGSTGSAGRTSNASDDFFAAPPSSATPAAVSAAPAAVPSAFSSVLPTPLPAPGALPTTAPAAALAATSAAPAAVPAIPSASAATAAAPSSFFAASFGSAGGQQQQQPQQGAERHSSGSSALDFFSQLSGITSSVLSGTSSSSSSAHPSGATHTNDPAAAGMGAFTGNFSGSFPASQPYASHDGQFGQFVKPELANPVVQEILQSLPDLSFMLADHLVVPGRDPGGLREFNSRPKVSAASIIASCVPRRAMEHAAAEPAAGGTGAEAGAAAGAAAAGLVDSAESATTSVAATNAAATMEVEESEKQQVSAAAEFDSFQETPAVGHAAITAPAANMASGAPGVDGSAAAGSEPGMVPPVAETSVSSVIAGMSMGGFMDAEEDTDDWGDFES